MSIVKAKVIGYDEASQSLLVSFASDKTKSQNPADYPAYAIQTSAWGENATLENIQHTIAKLGIGVIKEQEAKEAASRNPNNVAAIQQLLGSEFSYSLDDANTEISYVNEVQL